MSAPGPESVPTSADPRSHRPTKRRALTPVSAQAASVDALFAKPDREIQVPDTSLAPRARPPPPEIVTNVQGSSAGAGSGEFHVYKASRRREYERLREMDAEVRREKDQVQYDEDRAERERRDEERTRKNREKREKMKARKGKKGKQQGKPGVAPGSQATAAKSSSGASTKEGDAPDTTTTAAAKELGLEAEPGSDATKEAVGLVIHDDD